MTAAEQQQGDAGEGNEYDERYDRQVRVWGVETQRRLTAARVVVIGMTGLAAEVCKNIVLAGVGHVTLMDDTPVSGAHPGNFLVPASSDPSASAASIAAATLKEMNPLVTVGEAPDYGGKPEALGDRFDVVLLAGRPIAEQEAVNEWCRGKGVAFYAAESRGMAAHFFADLQEHKFVVTRKGGADEEPVDESRELSYPSLKAALSVSWNKLPRRCCKLYYALCVCAALERKLGRRLAPGDADALREMRSELIKAEGVAATVLPEEVLLAAAPAGGDGGGGEGGALMPAVAAVCGGVLGQEIIKAVSRKGEPVCNFFFFGAHDGDGMIELVGDK